MDDLFDVTPLDGLVSFSTPCQSYTLNPDEASRLGMALLRAAGVADWKSNDDLDGTDFTVTDEEPAF